MLFLVPMPGVRHLTTTIESPAGEGSPRSAGEYRRDHVSSMKSDWGLLDDDLRFAGRLLAEERGVQGLRLGDGDVVDQEADAALGDDVSGAVAELDADNGGGAGGVGVGGGTHEHGQ